MSEKRDTKDGHKVYSESELIEILNSPGAKQALAVYDSDALDRVSELSYGMLEEGIAPWVILAIMLPAAFKAGYEKGIAQPPLVV